MNCHLSNQFLSDWPHLMLVMKLLLNLLILVTVSTGETGPSGTVNDELSPKEAKSRLGLLAKRMDKDDDGFIDKKELSNWLFHSMKMLSQNQANEKFKEYDTDKSGFIEWNEFKTFKLKDLLKEGGSVPDHKEQLDEEKLIFDAADDDKDGKLDINEHHSFFDPYNYPDKMALVMLELLDKIKDINKDGKIDFEEYLKSRDGANHDSDEQKKIFLSTLDKNGDGICDKQEIMAELGRDKVNEVKDKTKQLISAADDNHDGKLSIEEIVSHHEVFGGSDNTNFGGHHQKVERLEDEL